MKLKNMKYAAAIASMAMAATSQAATIITTDGFNTGPMADTWNTNGSITAGQWSLSQTTTGGGRLIIGDPFGYGGQANPQEGTGQAQFSNGTSATFAATLTDTAGHYFNAGDQVTINFFAAGRAAGENVFNLTVSLVGPTTLTYGGIYAGTHGSNAWEAKTTGAVTIVTAGIYNVQFAAAASDNEDRTTYLDSVSYSVVPEPSAALLGGLGMLALLRRRRA